jgi:hypothetical protein
LPTTTLESEKLLKSYKKKKGGRNAKGDEKFGTSFVRIECIALLYKF